jgi:hypothetical protein
MKKKRGARMRPAMIGCHLRFQSMPSIEIGYKKLPKRIETTIQTREPVEMIMKG